VRRFSLWTNLVLHMILSYAAYILGCIGTLGFVAVHHLFGHDSSFIIRLVEEPVWMGPEIAGVACGILTTRKIPTKLALIAWIPHFLFLADSVWSDCKHSNGCSAAWDTFFGPHCGATECLGQLLVTAPFYTAVAYSCGSFIFLALGRRKPGDKNPQTDGAVSDF